MSISLDRYKRLCRSTYNALLSAPDGLTVYELKRITVSQRSALKYVLNDNPLFYVDRWTHASRNRVLTQVWMAVPVDNPGDCPRPE